MDNVSCLKQRIDSLRTDILHLIAVEIIFRVYFFYHFVIKKIIYQKNKVAHENDKCHAYFPSLSIFVLL